MTTPLHNLQRRFTRAVVEPRRDPGLLGIINPGGTLNSEGALEVYQIAYTARIAEALLDTFATVGRALGDNYYNIACTYIRQHPSDFYDLGDYGGELPQFLSELHLGNPKVVPAYLGEVADFEWRFKNMFHRAGPTPLDPKQVAALASCGDVLLKFSHSYDLQEYDYLVYQLWQHRLQDEAPRFKWRKSQRLLINKHLLEVKITELSLFEAAYFKLLATGLSVEKALKQLQRSPRWRKATSREISGFFEKLLLSGVVIAAH